MFKIEKHVQVPTGTTRSHKYPFAKMEVGDSFAVPRELEAVVRRSVYVQNKREGAKNFMGRLDKVNNVYRVWRIAANTSAKAAA